ncbi:hypothetical protein [Arthrobacter sp. H35-D1]|uniref:hypothetical protein n=1 Tax=Arthrobacter sp. H35-D1 TaxID=3046202 RepID=UPI0024B949B6|nr:hypothetical protein [Arthrobacter sp. H35-D1]MDJ0314826.1 hypothetical protein [Arthrobacter sp. H35-D1]
MATSSWSQLTADLDQEDLAKLTAFRDYCRSLPDVEERVHSAEIAYARKRTFASAYIKSHYLEVGIELLRAVADPPPGAPHPSPQAMAEGTQPASGLLLQGTAEVRGARTG